MEQKSPSPQQELLTESNSSKPETTTTVISVAAASDLKYVMVELIQVFQQLHPRTEVRATYGSSGNLFAQLSNKAPFDIFFSADTEYPHKLIDQGHAIPETEFQYAIGQLVVWVRNESPLNVETPGLNVLLTPSVKKIAMANQKHAPYGRAAEAALRTSGIYDQVSERLVLGENVAQAAQFTESGAADAGLISHSLATAVEMNDKGRYWIVPADLYPKLVQGGVILSWAADRGATEAFRDFVTGDQGQGVLKRHGFLLPGE